MPKIPRQNIRHKFIIIPHHKRIPPRQPTNNLRILLDQHIHQFARKGIGVPGALFSRFGFTTTTFGIVSGRGGGGDAVG